MAAKTNGCFAFLLLHVAAAATPELRGMHLSAGSDLFQADSLSAGTSLRRAPDRHPDVALRAGESDLPSDDDQSMNEVVKQWFAGSKWPPADRGQLPPPDEQGGHRSSAVVLLIAALLLPCFGCLPLMHGGHFKALATAIAWRHMHQRAIVLHILRLAVPALFLMALQRAKHTVADGFSRSDVKAILELNGSRPVDASDAVLEYCMSLTMTYLVLMSMLFFVWHTAEEAQSGFRHLLHVSGLSRSAYIGATAGVQGMLQAYLSVAFVILMCGCVLEVRLVLWTSPALLLVSTLLLSASSVLTGYLLCLLCKSVRFASNMAMLVLVIVILVVPFVPFSDVVPAVGKQSWLALALPVIPAHRAFFELLSGCVRGRCLTLADVAGELGGMGTRWPSPHAMIVGSAVSYDMTPPGAFLGFIGLVLLQLLAGSTLVFLLDRRCNPPLHEPGSHSGDGLLHVKDLKHSYSWLNGAARTTLNGVSFKIAGGEMLGLLGPNGAGKTTCIRCITGEEAPSDGYVAVMPAKKVGAAIGLCPQETIVNGDLTVLENLLFFAFVRGAVGEAGNLCAAAILQATCLEEKSMSLPDQLSGGMRRRLAVGCAMIASPAVVILDEPTTGLDPVTRRGIWDTIAQVKESGGCCLLTTHMLEEAEILASQIVILRQGMVAAEGSVQQLKNEWGRGYMLSIVSEESKEEEAAHFISELLGPDDNVPVKSFRFGQATYKFTKDEEALGHLIISIARGKANKIKHWGISQASLEDAYVRIIQSE